MIGRKGPGVKDLSAKGRYRQEKKQEKGHKKLLAFLFVILLALLFRPFFLSEQEDESTEEKHEEMLPLHEKTVSRKNIYDRNFEELAVSFQLSSIYVKPLEFNDIASTVRQLAEVLELDEQKLQEELKNQRSFKWLAKNISQDKADKVAALGLAGIYFYKQEERFYPNRINASHIIGDVTDDHGLSGVELFYDNLLRENASKQGVLDTVDGPLAKDLVLTLDVAMQMMLEGEMLKLLSKTKNDTAVLENQTAMSALVMEAATGEIFSYAQLPAAGTLDPDRQMEGGLLTGQRDPGMLSMLFDVAAAYNEGRNVLSAAEVLPEKIHYLRPRKMKKKRVTRKIRWARFDDGSYGSIWLADAFVELGQLPGSGYSSLLNGQYAVDLPGSNGKPGTGISLLCSFAGLVNGGYGVAPHFLKAVFTENQGMQEWLWPHVNSEIIQSEASKSFVRFLQEAAPSSGSVTVAEILFPPEGFIVSEKDADHGAQVDGDDVPVIEGGNLITLAAVPAIRPELVMLLTIDGGRFDLAEESWVKQHVKKIMQRAWKQYRENRNRKTSRKPQSDRAEITEKWLAQHVTAGQGVVRSKRTAGKSMVDVHGMSLRRALQKLEYLEVKIVIHGSGAIVKQQPKAGAKLSADTVVVLQAEPGG